MMYGKDINDIPTLPDAYNMAHRLDKPMSRTNVLLVLSDIISDNTCSCCDRLKAIDLYLKAYTDYSDDIDTDVSIHIHYDDNYDDIVK